MINGNSAADIIGAVINEEAVRNAEETLLKYKDGKKALEDRVIEDEKWYRLRHWDTMQDRKEEIEPKSAWLFNSIMNKHADCMDNTPHANVLPHEQADEKDAQVITSILPVILEGNDFEKVYSDVMLHKIRGGTGIYAVTWDTSKMNGLGDISVKDANILNLFWEPGVKDIQKSKNVFYVQLVDNETLEATYPELKDKLSSDTLGVAKYVSDENIDTSNKSAVVDWYYKKMINGKTVLHFCKFCNGTVLYATENDRRPATDQMGEVIKPPMSETGLYDHGKYPFIFDPLFTIENSPAGFGYIDIGKDTQAYIDRCDKAIMKNMLSSAAPRFFIRGDGSVKEAEYADTKNDFIHVDGNLGQDSIVPVQRYPLDGIYMNVLQSKIDELKETTGNRDFSSGGTTSGVTAASAIAALQEAGSKLSRDLNKASFRAFRNVVYLVIELMRQFYDLPRKFRIIGERGAMEYITYSNDNIKPKFQEVMGKDVGAAMPIFDIEVTVERQSSYTRIAQNEMALAFYNGGFFDPARADQASACIEMMDFDHKQQVLDKVQKNGGMYQQMLRMQEALLLLAQIVDKDNGTHFAEDIAAQVNGTGGAAPSAASIQDIQPGGDGSGSGMDNVEKAKAETAERSAPR